MVGMDGGAAAEQRTRLLARAGLATHLLKGDQAGRAMKVSTRRHGSQPFQHVSVGVIPCAKFDVDEDKVVSWSIIAISFF